MESFEHRDKEDAVRLLARLDERTINMYNMMQKMERIYVTKDEFNPIRKVVYGLVSIVLVGVVWLVLQEIGLEKP